MPRLLANEFVFSTASIDERYNEYINPTTPPLQQYHSQHHQQQNLTSAQPGVSTQNRSSKSGSHSPPCQQMKTFTAPPVSDEGLNYSPTLQTEPQSQPQHHNVHIVSSIDDNDDEVDDGEPPTVEELSTSIRSDDEEGDFEGFDDNCTPDFMQQGKSQENDDTEQQHRCVLKRHSQVDYHDYREDSEGVVEAIEVDDDEDIEEVDGQILLRTKQQTKPVKEEDPYTEGTSHTPNKRKKHQSESVCDDGAVVSPTHLKTQQDQIVEINSDSTTISQKQKRHQINTKFQLNLNQRQNHRATNNAAANKCSTESTSEFPVSSPSNPQQPRGGGKYPPRPPLLKNTLPADSFERQLAMITACNPQMTLTEKIQSWCCEDEQSDVEDVNVFDREFKRLEEQRKRDIKKHKNKRSGGIVKQYDFSVFRQMIINNMNNQQHQRFLSGTGAVGSCSAGGGLKDINSTGSDSSKSAKLNDERPSTSAVAQQQLQLRRSKLSNMNTEASEIKKRFNKDLPKRNQNSTTPPATSSSENDRDCFQNSKHSGPNKRFNHGSQHLHVHEKMLCPSSSEEANSQDVPTHMQLKANQRMAQIAGERNVRQKLPLKPPQNKSSSKNLRCIPGEEIDSVFRLHRLNREIDKPMNYRTDLKQPPKTLVDGSDYDHNEAQMKFAQTRLNFGEEDKKSDQIDYAKKQDIFKTPIVPPKYLATLSVSADSPPLQYYCSASNVNASSEQNSATVTAALETIEIINSIPTATANITTTKVKLENVGTDTDFDGVYHQQHEFCNYLGLTGMSTATAMANAVAELAQCNLTRRSMRVMRLQQQERREKSTKEDRDSSSLKTKQLKEVRKRERGGYELPVESEESLLFYEEGTNSQTSEQPTRSTPSLKGYRKKNINLLATAKSPTKKSQQPVTTIKTEPQIKILCHIETTKQEDVEKISKECVKEIAQPMRQSLMRQSKTKNNLKNPKRSKIFDNKEEIRSETKTGCVHDGELKLEEIQLPDSNVDGNEKILRSPRLKSLRSKVKQTKIKTDIPEDMEQKLLNHQEFLSEQREKTSRLEEVTTPLDNIETVDSDFGHALIMQTQLKCSPLPIKEIINKDLNMVEAIQISGANEHLEECDRALTPTAAPIQEKLQAALEESRKTKPSIFIVQSFECKKEKTTKPVSILEPLQKEKIEMKPVITTGPQPATTSPSKVEIKKQMSNEQSDNRPVQSATIIKKKNSKKHLKPPRKSKKHSIFSLKNGSKRQLRSHKIIFIKSSKSEENIKEEMPIEVKRLRSHNKSLPKYNQYKHNLLTEKATINSLAPSTSQSVATINNTKSYRNAQTETKDLEMYNNQAKTRLMAKATALLQRSRRVSVTRGINNSINLRSKFSAKLRRSTISLRTATSKTQILQPKICLVRSNINAPKKEYKTSSTSTTPPPSEVKADVLKQMTSSALKVASTTENQQQPSKTFFLNQENDNVVVSSTTNSFDERPHINPLLIPSPITLRSVHSSTPCGIASTPLETKDSWTQIDNNVQGIRYLNSPPSATHIMRNPLKTEHGVVLYIYYEVDILIVVQERLVSFWKCSRLLSALSVIPTTQQQKQFNPIVNMISSQASSSAQIKSDIFTSDSLHTSSCIDVQIREPALTSSSLETSHQLNGEWILLGELKRLTYDLEVFAPYANRICLHNSTPIYMEMRARRLPKNHRDCNLLSMYINIYYYHDEDIIAKTNSIQLDTIQSDVKTVNYTTLIDSRYFIMTWPQENLLGKTRSGLCKYSLTPQLDTLASIREFKSMRHTIRYLECMSDDKLIGFGDSQLTIWDHRSGDVLMNFDLDIPLGKNLGSVYYSSQEIEQNNMIILFQWRDIKPNEPPELLTIACTITHVQPSYRILYQLTLPPAFRKIKRAINTGEHLIIIGSESGESEEELWISCANPSLVALIPPLRQEKKRFYNRERSQLIELTEKTLSLDTLANHNLKLAAGLALNTV